ncbi:glycine/betaine ABC transporter substrate-binding protein [Desulfocarbo indianensis]|nr:glycine/betaine ABC transporter substrate-binding protein [Desulfocarbo indianensis]
MKLFSKKLILAAALCLALTGLAFAPAVMAKDKVKLVYVEWSCATASTNLAKAVIQDKLGYDVKLLPVSAAAMWQAVSTGDADGFTTAWLPTTHADYYKKVQDKVENLGPMLKGTRIGLVVPQYVTIKSIGDMEKEHAKFDDKIVGIDPGAGIMSKTEIAVKEYGLKSFKLVESSGAAMTAALADAIKNKKWIAVTGWTPHWKFGRWELKYLEDPKGVYGGTEEIDTVVRKGLKKDMPKVYDFLKNFKLTPAELETLMAWNQAKGADPFKSAQKWMKENPEKVEAWLK